MHPCLNEPTYEGEDVCPATTGTVGRRTDRTTDRRYHRPTWPRSASTPKIQLTRPTKGSKAPGRSSSTRFKAAYETRVWLEHGSTNNYFRSSPRTLWGPTWTQTQSIVHRRTPGWNISNGVLAIFESADRSTRARGSVLDTSLRKAANDPGLPRSHAGART